MPTYQGYKILTASQTISNAKFHFALVNKGIQANTGYIPPLNEEQGNRSQYIKNDCFVF